MRLRIARAEVDCQAGGSDRGLVLAVHRLGFGKHRARSRQLRVQLERPSRGLVEPLARQGTRASPA
jgi:hypothetical protein